MDDSIKNKKMKIKVCGMRDPENISQVCKSMPDFLGFIFFNCSSRYVGENPDPSIFNNVPDGIVKVGVFVNERPEKIISLQKKYHLGLVQLHGNESPEECKKIRDCNIKVTKVFSVGEDFDFNILKKYETFADYFLFDTKGKLYGGNGKKFNWSVLNRYKGPLPFFLSGGISPSDAEEIKEFNHPFCFAVDVNSGFEIKPSYKDSKKVAGFIQSVRK